MERWLLSEKPFKWAMGAFYLSAAMCLGTNMKSCVREANAQEEPLERICAYAYERDDMNLVLYDVDCDKQLDYGAFTMDGETQPTLFWQDRNDDGEPQMNEFYRLEDSI